MITMPYLTIQLTACSDCEIACTDTLLRFQKTQILLEEWLIIIDYEIPSCSIVSLILAVSPPLFCFNLLPRKHKLETFLLRNIALIPSS